MRVFLSYARADARLADRIARDSGLQLWEDTQIFPGDNWAAKIGDALRDSDAMVVLLTPSSLSADFIQGREVGYALGSQD
jgi:hypothetical protein